MSVVDRLGEVIPHTGRAWAEAIAIAIGLGVVIFVVLPRLVRRLADGSFFVRLEDIETPHAPAVFVYLVPRPTQTEPGGGIDRGRPQGQRREPELCRAR